MKQIDFVKNDRNSRDVDFKIIRFITLHWELRVQIHLDSLSIFSKSIQNGRYNPLNLQNMQNQKQF
jgi:hypothetical protein